MDQNKASGSYYTPYGLIDFMNKYLQKNRQDFSNVLEPSAGDGRFLSVLLKESKRVKAIEVFEDKVGTILKNYSNEKLQVQKINFLDYAKSSDEKYSLIIGNPPYISPKNMEKDDVKKAREICESENVATSIMQNMWLAFVVGACKLLKKNGTIFFVLPMEFLQVQYAEKLREHLEKKFNTIHILTFETSFFPDIEQDTCLVYLTNRVNETPHILYEVYENEKSFSPILKNVIKKNKPLKKWSNAILTDEEIMLLKERSSNYGLIRDKGNSAPGIVTGGNKYFILTDQQVREYECEEFVIPILQKSSYISSDTIVLNETSYEELRRRNKPVFLLNLSDVKLSEMPIGLKRYLEWAEKQEDGGVKLVDRYKCKSREPWYGVPIVNKGDVIFFKRYHIVPRVYINQVDIHTTDAGYHIRLNEGIDKDSFVFCFYNSLTLAQCEFFGRYYGGGVSELVPSEFKELRVPYYKIEKSDVYRLNKMFHDKEDIQKIVAFVNEKTIANDMTEQDVRKIEDIRRKLIGRRCRGKE